MRVEAQIHLQQKTVLRAKRGERMEFGACHKKKRKAREDAKEMFCAKRREKYNFWPLPGAPNQDIRTPDWDTRTPAEPWIWVSATRLGHRDTRPGHCDTRLGHWDTRSGHSDTRPGHRDTKPGHWDTRPGHRDTTGIPLSRRVHFCIPSRH